MKLLATIKDVRLARQYEREDHSWGQVYKVTIESGDDTIIAECYSSKEYQAQQGIVPGAIGDVTLKMSLSKNTGRDGFQFQQISLTRFALANAHIKTQATEAATEQPAAETTQEAAPAAPAAVAANIDPTTGLPF
jgi:hypothetical protein